MSQIDSYYDKLLGISHPSEGPVSRFSRTIDSLDVTVSQNPNPTEDLLNAYFEEVKQATNDVKELK